MACLCSKICRFSAGFHVNIYFKRTYSSSLTHSPDFDIEKCFLRDDVQSILKRITGFDLNKIFHERKMDNLQPPKYKLLTTKQLEEFENEAAEQGRKLLAMPPVKKSWQLGQSHILAKDDIEMWDADSDSSYVFTDITYGLPHRERSVVVREANGVLRFATPEERDRTLNTYFPRPGKMYAMPQMFNEDQLEKVLAEHRYEYILDRACVQFEPDDPNYIRVTQRTYEHIAECCQFDGLRSTRHFGPMVFYLTIHRKIDSLLVNMLQRRLLNDAGDVIRLFHIIHTDSKSAAEAARQTITDNHQLVSLYCEYEAGAVNQGAVQLALQSLDESSSAVSTL